MASNNSNTHNATPGQQNNSNGLGDHGHPHPQQHQQVVHHHQNHHHHHHHHDPHGPAGVPIMHVDELLSAEFPLNMGNGAHHTSGPLNSGAQANIMEGLDDLFGDDFSAPSTTTATSTATTVTTTTATTGATAHNSSSHVGLPLVHLPQPSQPQHTAVSHPQSLPPNMHFPGTSGPTHSPQPRVLQQHPHQQPLPAPLDSPSAIPASLTPGHHTPGTRISPQTPQPASTAHVSHAPQITPGMHAMQQSRPQAIATPGLPQQYQQQQATLQQQQAALQQHQQQQQQAQHHAHITQQSLQPAVAPRPVFPSPQHHQAALSQAAALLPRPVQPNIVQMPPTASTPVVPNGHTPIPSVATPAIVTPAAAPTPTSAPAAPVVLAGSPLHHILGTTSPETGQQLRNLFTLLQTNVVTPNEFLARAEQLLEPAQFQILDVIRRRHVPQPQSQPQQSNSGPATSTPAVNSPITTANTSAASSPMHQPQSATAGSVRSAGAQHISTPAVPTPVQPATPQPTPVAPAATVSQSAPVRKRNIDTTSVATPPNESKTKRPKMEQQQIAAGAGAVNGTAAGPLTPVLPSALGTATSVGVASPGAFKGVSLPGQQKAVTVAPSAATAGAAGGAGAATGATTAATGTTARSGGGGGSGAASTEKVNYDNITDVMGYVGGVDLREETDNIMRDSDGYSKSGGGDGQDRTRIQNFVDIGLLKTTIERIAATHRIQTIEPDVLAYLAMATQERLRGLAEQMVHASKHRGRSLATANPPMYDEDHAMYRVGVSQDVKKQLLAVERVEREEETKRKEHIAERERRLAAGEDLDENGDPRGGSGGAGAKKKKQKEGGPGVSARNMTEEARKKVANQTAMGFAGGSGRTYSWMMGGGGAGGLGGGAASPSPLAGPSIVASTGTGSVAGSPSASGTAANGIGGPLKPTLARGSTMSTSATPSGALTPGGGGVGGDGGAAGSGAVGSPSLVRGAGAGGSMILPPSTLGRPTNLRDSSRKVNIRDALFCLERDRGGGGGEGSGQRVLVKSYVKWLK
ncbi:hypothetical protein BG015_007326 [Linnemannia schmuckeri]|uniref:Transcription initiation factor TFIID subunit 4 n=1 Tax=Linnemannia schmuckeri TaxID=64567 RepID=A0A9P5RZ13_9FUNG|nr:hypothetical protein BG015_007326 [Linnemannia schmuckeri]